MEGLWVSHRGPVERDVHPDVASRAQRELRRRLSASLSSCGQPGQEDAYSDAPG
jgi:hypothetical protein